MELSELLGGYANCIVSSNVPAILPNPDHSGWCAAQAFDFTTRKNDEITSTSARRVIVRGSSLVKNFAVYRVESVICWLHICWLPQSPLRGQRFLLSVAGGLQSLTTRLHGEPPTAPNR